MTEAGTLSIVRCGTYYQAHYAANNRHDLERLPHACPNETHLAAFLHHCGTECAMIAQVCAACAKGRWRPCSSTSR
jgi:hypothetical protein